jgi:hypothetical protein
VDTVSLYLHLGCKFGVLCELSGFDASIAFAFERERQCDALESIKNVIGDEWIADDIVPVSQR